MATHHPDFLPRRSLLVTALPLVHAHSRAAVMLTPGLPVISHMAFYKNGDSEGGLAHREGWKRPCWERLEPGARGDVAGPGLALLPFESQEAGGPGNMDV